MNEPDAIQFTRQLCTNIVLVSRDHFLASATLRREQCLIAIAVQTDAVRLRSNGKKTRPLDEGEWAVVACRRAQKAAYSAALQRGGRADQVFVPLGL